MTVLTFFTSLFSFGISWIEKALYTACLFLDGIVYFLVSYCYNLFIIMCNINYNSLYGIVSGLINRLEAVVMVFVVFKAGLALIQYMIDPEKASKEGSKILVNIFITAALLISYNFIFTVLNEISMLVIGNPTGYDYVVLGQIAGVEGKKDEGLIMRFIFGNSKVEDIGDYMAYSTLTIFLHDYNSPQTSDEVKNVICRNSNGKCDYMKLTDLVSKIKLRVDYTPVIGFVVGLYLIYSLVKAAIQIGVRMFKMLILQILAPVAIISIIGDGLKADVFSKFIKKYISVYIEAFVRMFSMLIVSVFVCKIFINIGDYFMQLDTGDGFTTGLVTVLVVIAAFKFAGDIPKFIDDILSTHLGDSKGGGFGHFIGGMLGAGIGLATGLSTGTLAGTVAGLAGGISAGAKGKNVADFFKGQAQNGANARNVGANARMAGGSFAYAGSKVGGFFGAPQRRLEKGKLAGERQTAMDNMVKTMEDYYDGKVTIGGQEIGLTRDIFKNYAYDSGWTDPGTGQSYYDQLSSSTREYVDRTAAAYENYTAAQGAYDRLRASGTATDADLQSAYEDVESARTAWSSLKATTDKRIDTDFNTKMLRDIHEDSEHMVKEKGRNAVSRSIETYDNVAAGGYSTRDFRAGRSNTKTASDHYTEQQDKTTHSRSAERFTRTNSRGGK